jgi:hypothetical protein
MKFENYLKCLKKDQSFMVESLRKLAKFKRKNYLELLKRLRRIIHKILADKDNIDYNQVFI